MNGKQDASLLKGTLQKQQQQLWQQQLQQQEQLSADLLQSINIRMHIAGQHEAFGYRELADRTRAEATDLLNLLHPLSGVQQPVNNWQASVTDSRTDMSVQKE